MAPLPAGAPVKEGGLITWFKVDDKLWGHPKWLATPPRARGLWATAGSWAADHEQDGHIPRHVLPILGGTAADARALVDAGLWSEAADGWLFHGWDEFQPTRAQKDADRAEAKERMRLIREERKRKRSEGVRANNSEHDSVFGECSEDVRSTPTRPDPTRPVVGLLSVVGDGSPSSSSSGSVKRRGSNG